MAKTPLTAQQPTIETKPAAGGAWTAAPAGLFCESATAALSPTIPTATFAFRYGKGRTIGTDSPFERERTVATNLVGRLVRVRCGSPLTTVWVGRIAEFADSPGAADACATGTGRVILTAFGIEHELAAQPILDAHVKDGETLRRIDRLPAFNRREKIGAGLLGNKAADAHAFGMEEADISGANQSTGDTPAAIWTAADVIVYALTRLTPSGFPYIQFPSATAAWSNLEKITDVWAQGNTIGELLNRVIDRRRGHAWRIVENQAGDFQLQITTCFAEAITVGGVAMTPSAVTATLDLDADGNGTQSVQIRRSQAAPAREIIGRGEPIWCCGSMTVAKGWTDAEEAAYVAAAEAEDLADAASEKWSNVYRTFVPLSATSPFGTPLPRCTDSGTLAYDGWLYPVGKTLTRQTPLRQDVDYSENLPGTARAGVPRDLRPPAVYAIPNAPDEETGTIGYVPIDRFSAIEEWGLGGCHVSVLDDRVGIRLAGAFAHAAAGEWEADTWSEPETDWTTLQVCAAVRCDDRLRIVEAVAGTAGQLPRRVVIDVPGAELWVVLAGTPLDTADGNIVSAAENTVIRDDTDRLKPVAALAKAWYGRQRNACRIAYRQIATALAPGDILTTVTVGGGSADVNCPISGVTWDFAACRTEIETDFAELDFAAIAAVHHPHGAYSAVDGWNDSGRADAAMPNSPVRLAAAGGVKPQRPTRLGKYIASPAFVDGDETVWLAPCDDDGTVTDEPAVEVYLIAPPAGQTRTPRLTFTGSGTYPYFLTEEGRAVLGNAEMPPHLVLVEGGTDVNGIDPVADGQGWISKRDDDTLEHRDPRPEDNIIFRSCSVTGWAFDQRGHLTGWWENQYIEGEWQEVWTSPWGYDEPEELVLDEFTVTGAAEGAQCTTSPTWTGGGNPTNRRLVVEWGDGSSNTYEEAVSGAARTHTYTHCTEAVSHDYPVTIRTGGKHKHATCTVTNIAPTDVSGTLADNTIGVGEEAVMTVTWANAYATDTHTVHINWGDGITTDTPNATSPCVVRHTYVAPYTGAVLVSVEDDDGAVVSDATQPTITVTGPPIEVDAGIDEIIDVDESILHEITWTGGYGAFQVRAWADGIDPEDGFVENGVSSPYNLAIGPSPAPMGPVTIHVRITDSSGTQDEDTFTLTVVEP